MPKKRSQLCQRTKIESYRFLDHLVVVVEGSLPSPGWDVDIEQRPSHDGVLSFQAVRRARAGMWPQVVTPFRYGELFEVESVPLEVEVVHAEGADRVPVRTDRVGLADPALQGQPPVGAPHEGPLVHSATGFSPALSFDEAFADALQNLPSHEVSHADEMARIKVEEIGALFGGIAGFHQMYVKIRREIA